MKILLLVNPVSGKARGIKFATAAISALEEKGHTCFAVIGESQADCESSYARALHEFAPEIVLAVGGDGLVHTAIQKLAHTSIALAILPAGTGNDFASTHDFAALDIDIAMRQIKEIDLGLVSIGERTEWFGQVLSTGFDSLVNRRANRFSRVKGRIKYTIATLLELFSFQPISYQMIIDGKARDTKAMLIAVANGPTYGGGMKIVPSADYQDGFLDILVLKPVSKIELLKVFPKVFKGTHITHPAVEIIKAKSIFLAADTLAYADGEFVDQLPIRVEVIPQALKLVDMR